MKLTAQAFSYGTLGKNNMIYIPPFAKGSVVDYMIKVNPETYECTRIPLEVSDGVEKWMTGTQYDNLLIFLPHNETKILIVNTDDDSVQYIDIGFDARAKYYSAILYKDRIIGLPYGIDNDYDYILVLDIPTLTVKMIKVEFEINDEKKWSEAQLVGNIIHALPRGERWSTDYFPYRLEFNCDTLEYQLFDLRPIWHTIDKNWYSNKKFTSLARYKDKLYAPPYCENELFDIMMSFDGKEWHHEHTGLTGDSRKFHSYVVTKNGKLYFPPAGHGRDWATMMIIDGETGKWHTVDIPGLTLENKKYFAGIENSQGKAYFIPRGGCECEELSSWKSDGDLTELLVIDSKDDSIRTVNIGKHFTENTTIEKYNQCLIYKDVIFAFPFGQSDTFHQLLVFDTISETVVKMIDLSKV